MDFEKVYDRVNREAIWQLMKMSDVGGKLLSDIMSINVNSLGCVRLSVSGSMWCETGLYVPLAFQCKYGCSDERGENGDGEEGILEIA